MRSSCAILLLLAAGACTEYQPVVWDGQGSWAQARAAATARAEATEQVVAHRPQSLPDDVRRFEAPAEPGPRHRVAPGETLSGIAARYAVPVATLAKLNDIAPNARIRAGQALTLPRSARLARPAKPTAAAVVASRPPAAPPPTRATAVIASSNLPPLPGASERRLEAAAGKLAAAGPGLTPVAVAATEAAPALEPPPVSREQAEATRQAAQKTPPPLSGDGFLWPVRGEIASGFGEKPNGARNNGINIKAAAGTPVLAAENGVVVYAGDALPGYGNLLLISHAQGFTTAYAHNQDLLARVGDVVARGQRIATVGTTGGVATPQLHFELREGKKPIDPIAHLETARTRMASSR